MKYRLDVFVSIGLTALDVSSFGAASLPSGVVEDDGGAEGFVGSLLAKYEHWDVSALV